MMAFLAELQRRKLQTYVAEAEALLWFEDAAVRAGPATRELLDPARYGLDRSLVAVSGEIACAMPKYSQLLRTVVAQIQVLTEVFREGFEKAFGKDAWDEIYGKNKS
jgi:hypothetical protein